MRKTLPKPFVAMCFFGFSLGAAQALTLDLVTVGNVGNANDATGYGGVNYEYQISTYEVTLLQYTAFLNAVARTDTYGLYNPSMGTAITMAGIAQANSPGTFAYSVIGDGNRPVTFVNWFDAARFANWLHHGQPVGLQMAGTTEDGAYALSGATSGVAFSKSLSAQYWLPSEDEWYKAAYFQPTAAGGDVDGYWEHSMQTNNVPFSDQPPGTTPDNTRVGNFFEDDGLANGFNDGYAVYAGGDALTPVGAYAASDSYYGTFDQGGNVFEWNDAVITGSRGLRGGAWNTGEGFLRASFRGYGDPTGEGDYIGFRVASVPEPAAAVSLLLAGGLLLLRRRRAV